ncbi:hypothetical protein CWI80_04030 [Pseudidiomarina sediminum]|uniref:Uncharacterized protein n=1 Tax=Pseudidiomarina sediminum TaxID=431675 RepID=A0A432Z9D1_9GAMM|nr:hypothetical protein [Pseudidiomarina sediminum]RUO74518.1 hypothetical protein CWI80_04030 [Pseudidiomarina sediminum]
MKFPEHNAFIWTIGISGVLYAGIMLGVIFSGAPSSLGALSGFWTSITSMGALIVGALALGEWKRQLRRKAVVRVLTNWHDLQHELREAKYFCSVIRDHLHNRQSPPTGACTSSYDCSVKTSAKISLEKAYGIFKKLEFAILDLPSGLGEQIESIRDCVEEMYLGPEGIGFTGAAIHSPAHEGILRFTQNLNQLCDRCTYANMAQLRDELRGNVRL